MKKLAFLAFTILTMIGIETSAQNFKGYQWETLTCKGEPVQCHEAAFIEANSKFS